MKKRKLLSIVLSVFMALALMPQVVFADDISGEHNEAVIVNPGDTISGGTFNGQVNNKGTIKNGTFTDNVENGGLITGGAFNGTVENIIGIINDGTFNGRVINVGSGIINGGTFSGSGNVVNDSGGIINAGTFDAKVDNNGEIKGGTFNGEVDNSTGRINGGTFYDTVDNECGVIERGTFYDTVDNEDGGIAGGTFYGGIVNNGRSQVIGSCHIVSFDLNGGSGSIPSQWFVNTDTAQALEPDTDPTREGYSFNGWYIDEALTIAYDFSSAVSNNIILYAGWDEIITLTVPFTTTVELGGNVAPGKTVFDLQVVNSSGDKLSSGDVEVETTPVKTNGEGDYDGTLKIKGTSEDIAKMLRDKVFVKQAEEDYPNWKVDDTVWGLVWQDEVVALASADDAASNNSVFIFPAEYNETENGGYYEMIRGKDAVEKMSFINKYTKTVTNPSGSEDATNGDLDNGSDSGNSKVSKTDVKSSVKTGDTTDLSLWIALMLLSGAGVIGVTLYTRRKRTNG